MASDGDQAFHILAGLFILSLIAVGAQRLLRPPQPPPRILAGPGPLLHDPDGAEVRLAAALPPQGSGWLLLFHFPGDSRARRLISRAWLSIRRQYKTPLRAVMITRRPDRIHNIAAWMNMPDPLWMNPDVFYDRLRIPGLPALLYFVKGELRKCRVMAR